MKNKKSIRERFNSCSRQKVREKFARGLAVVMAAVLAFSGLNVTSSVATAANVDNKKLQNGSFQEGESSQGWARVYNTLSQDLVPGWKTTAINGKIELFKGNTGTYITGVTLTPTAGTIAAELNADEESTLYQNVNTEPYSIYQWGLDHGARNGTDTMALVIGPKQQYDP
ncbi:MAG: hypothetical protein ACI4JS_03120 [Oscillospiraceae bacterium]